MDAISPVVEADARTLLRDYANALDRGQLAEWPNFFAEVCSYRITTRDNESRGRPLSIMLCNNRAMLFDRIEATEKANIFEPHSYRHILSDSEVVAKTADLIRVRTGFICVRIMHSGETTLFASGEYVDEVVRENGRCRFRSKAVILDSSQIDTLIAIPL
jgi:anthranilate 1,2-dioxygenase small subunit